MTKSSFLLIASLTALAAGVVACPADTSDVCVTPGVAPCPTDGGADTTTNDADAGCDSKTSNCIDPTKGVFVSPSGNDSNDGSQANPLKTIGTGLTKAKAAAKSRVYICAGTYAENVDIKDPIDLLGGFACNDWSYAAANDATIAPASGIAVHVTSVTTSISDLKLVSADGATAGDSSIAAFVDTSTVTFLRASLNAGKGVTGGNGTTGSNYTATTQGDVSIAGHDASGTAGGTIHTCALCTDTNNSIGGLGGAGGGAPTDGQNGQPNLGGTSPNDGLAGTKAGTGNTPACKNGDNGAAADAGASAPAISVIGVVDSSGWKQSTGANGANGAVAQGGGGGGGGYDVSNLKGGAGGGGCGGCGGAAGSGGHGGGASIALLAYNSTVTLTSSELHAANAGNGGTGAAGQPGQLGGFSGQNNNPGCSGGTGGTGGSGGSGAGGAGGIAVGVAWKGAGAPTIDSDTQSKITFGTKGTKGTGGSAGVNDGVDGVAQAIYPVP